MEKVYFCNGSYHNNLCGRFLAAENRFHKFWFLVLENPSSQLGFSC